MARNQIVPPHDKGWTRLGPGGGGTIYHPTISPHDPNIVITTCDMTGQYVTRDGGATWHMTNLMIWCDTFAFDPIDPKRIYAGANALYASDDLGETWRIIWPDADAVCETHLVGDEASPIYVGEGWPGGRVMALAIDRSNNSRILAGVAAGRRGRGDGRSTLHLSEDRGGTWRRVAELNGSQVHRVVLNGDSDLWAITSSAVHHSTDSGRTWIESRPAGESRILGGDIGFAADGRPLLYVLIAPDDHSKGGLYVSRDGGREWRYTGVGVTTEFSIAEADGTIPARAIAVCRDKPEVAYLSISISMPQPGGGAADQFGIVKTTDAGTTWAWVWQARPGHEPENFELDWLTKSYTSSWPGPAGWVGAAPANPDICYASNSGNCIMTADGGRNWRQCTNSFDSEGGACTRGLDVTTCYGVHFDPHHPDVAFISYTDIGLHKSRNRGLTWHHAINGVPNAWRNTCYWLVFDPDVPNTVWSVWSGGHDYPRSKMFRNADVARFRGGVCVSSDNGETWRPTIQGMPEVGCTNIVLDPTSPKGRRTLYVSAFGRGVYKSIDDGASWVLCNNGLGGNLNAWWLAGDPSQTMYLLIFRTIRDGKSVPGGIYHTSDGAASWERLPISDEIPSPNDLIIAPDDPAVMYVAAWPVALPDRIVPGGVFKTTDSGRTWERLPFEPQYVYGVAIDPQEPDVLYATAWHHGLLRSEDGGRSWSHLGGANFGWPHRIFPDPFDRSRIYLTTFGGSVWHGRKRGAVGVGPDIVNLPPVARVDP